MSAPPRGEFGSNSTGQDTLSYLRDVLADNIAGQDLPLNSFAAICGLHPRRLQRILSAAGTSYSQIKDDVRRSLTEDLLSDKTKPMDEIAQRVGLSGPAALHRAFRRWTGKTPTRFRAETSHGQIA